VYRVSLSALSVRENEGENEKKRERERRADLELINGEFGLYEG